MAGKLGTLSHQLIHSKVPEMLDVFELMEPNALARAKSQQKTITKQYMDLEFSVCH
jgi:hypothetical protein